MKVQKILNYFSILTLLVAIFMVLVVTYWASYPYKPAVIKNSPMPVNSKTVKTGDTLIYLLDYCRSTSNEARISRRFVDGIIFSVPDITATNPVGCAKRNIGVEIPNTLPSGTYTLQVFYFYQVNPIRSVVISGETESFEVINKQIDKD